MKPLNFFLTLGLAAMIPVTALADRSGSRRCGNDRSYSSNWGGGYGGWGNIPRNPYGGPRAWNSGSWNSGSWNSSGWGYGGNGFGGNRQGVYRADNLVQNGVRSGALSRDEVRDIREDQHDIRQKEQRYWSDGRLNNRERNDLRGDYRDMYKDIQHNLNDGERRYRIR